MIDGVIAGTGNSRYLKSSISADTTLAEIVTMLRAGTFPIDLNGLNEAGWTTLATALSKANLLSDTTAAAINTLYGTTPTTPNNALAYITSVAQTLHDGRVQLATGSYTGTGLYGLDHPNSVTLPFTPDIFSIYAIKLNDTTYHSAPSFVKITNGMTAYVNGMIALSSGSFTICTNRFQCADNVVSWVCLNNASAQNQLNTSGYVYYYMAIKLG